MTKRFLAASPGPRSRTLEVAGFAAAVAASLMTCASSASATSTAGTSPSYLVSYDATSTYRIDDIAIYQSSSSASSVTNSFSAFVGEWTINNPFSVAEIPTGDFLLGVATDFATDADGGQQHLVLFSNDAFAAGATGVAFDTLFPNSSETGLINDLEVLAQAVRGDANAAYTDIFNFAAGDAVGGPNGSVLFATGDSFTELAFSDGQVVGAGVSAATLVPGVVAAAPEPSTWALMLAGVAVAGLALRGGAGRSSARAGVRFGSA